MKKLNKLQINSEKLMKSEELIILRGGYGGGYGSGPCTCCCVDYEAACCYGYLVSESGDCAKDCKDVFGTNAGGACYNCGPSCPSC